MPVKMMVSPKSLTWLGGAFAAATKLSPFANFRAEGFGTSDMDELVKAGVVNESSVMTPESFAAFDLLAKATKFAHFKLLTGNGLIERYVYFTADGSASVDNADGMLEITYPPDNMNYAAYLSQFTGNTVVSASSFSAEWDAETALVFAGLADLHRIAFLNHYANDENVIAPASFTLDEVERFISAQKSPGKWLTGILQTILQTGMSSGNRNDAIARLISDRMVDAVDGKLALTGDAASFAEAFPVMENLISLECAAEGADGNVTASQCHFAQAGVSGILQIMPGADRIAFDAVSSSMMLDFITDFLTTPPEL